MTSSTNFFSRFGVHSTAAFKMKPSRSSGLVSLKEPFALRHPGVLSDVTIYASLIIPPISLYGSPAKERN
jgi:hypothetical protein